MGLFGRGPVKTDSASLREAVKKGDAGTIRRALEADPGVASRLDEDGMALLHWVAAIGDTKIAAVLLEKGAAIGVKKADDGWTPLALAALAGKLEMVEFLRSRGAAVDASVLTAAKENGRADILAALEPPRAAGKAGNPTKTADEYVREGTAASERQDWSSAIESMQAALKVDPKSGKAHCGLALAYGATFDMAKAKEHYLQLKKVDPALAARFEASPAGMMVARGGNIIAM